MNELSGVSGWVALLAGLVLLASTTAFVKASVVLGALRIGLGAEALLRWSTTTVLALLVTALVMAPTAAALLERWPAEGAAVPAWTELPELLEPLRAFVARHADPGELAFFAELQREPLDAPLVQVGAFLVTELNEALVMAVVILLPLVLVDLLVAQAMLLAGFAQQPPTLVVVPLKLVLFLAVGGWDVVIGGLVEGYR